MVAVSVRELPATSTLAITAFSKGSLFVPGAGAGRAGGLGGAGVVWGGGSWAGGWGVAKPTKEGRGGCEGGRAEWRGWRRRGWFGRGEVARRSGGLPTPESRLVRE